MQLFGGLNGIKGLQSRKRHVAFEVLFLLQAVLHCCFDASDAWIGAAFRVVYRIKTQQATTNTGCALFEWDSAVKSRRSFELLMDHAADNLVFCRTTNAVSVCAHEQYGRSATVFRFGVQMYRVQTK